MKTEDIVKCMDELFPKGDKRRGDALVLQAVAFLEGKEEALEVFSEGFISLTEVNKIIDEDYPDLTEEHNRQEFLNWKDELKQKLGGKNE